MLAVFGLQDCGWPSGTILHTPKFAADMLGKEIREDREAVLMKAFSFSCALGAKDILVVGSDGQFSIQVADRQLHGGHREFSDVSPNTRNENKECHRNSSRP
jgi:hypothetical protein